MPVVPMKESDNGRILITLPPVATAEQDVGNFDLNFSLSYGDPEPVPPEVSVLSLTDFDNSLPEPFNEPALVDPNISPFPFEEPEPIHDHEHTLMVTDNSSISYDQPAPFHEPSLMVPVPMEVSVHEEPMEIKWDIVDGATRKGRRQLVNSLGFSYAFNKQSKNGETAYWLCSKRTSAKCNARVNQKGDIFTPGACPHSCEANKGAIFVAKIRSAVNTAAIQQPFTAALSLVNNAMANIIPEGVACQAPAPTTLARNANRKREKGRPHHPTTLVFELNHHAIPEHFLQYDVTIEGNRHIMLATPHQIQLLKLAENWFVDGTFRVVRKPFSQMFSIHAFIRSGENLKQVPLFFAIMSGKRTVDYSTIFRWIADNVGPTKLQTITCDFEAAVWIATKNVFPTVSLHGCLFHWNQAIYRKIQELGMQAAYHEKRDVFIFCRRLMALPFLPAAYIPRVFSDIFSPNIAGPLRDLMTYMEAQWIASTTFPIHSWSVFQRPFRTNNDCEGWHNKLNQNVNAGGLNLYLLIKRLHEEATCVVITCQLLEQGQIMRCQRIMYRELHKKIMGLWEKFDNRDLNVQQLLNKCSYLNGP